MASLPTPSWTNPATIAFNAEDCESWVIPARQAFMFCWIPALGITGNQKGFSLVGDNLTQAYPSTINWWSTGVNADPALENETSHQGWIGPTMPVGNPICVAQTASGPGLTHVFAHGPIPDNTGEAYLCGVHHNYANCQFNYKYVDQRKLIWETRDHTLSFGINELPAATPIGVVATQHGRERHMVVNGQYEVSGTTGYDQLANNTGAISAAGPKNVFTTKVASLRTPFMIYAIIRGTFPMSVRKRLSVDPMGLVRNVKFSVPLGNTLGVTAYNDFIINVANNLLLNRDAELPYEHKLELNIDNVLPFSATLDILKDNAVPFSNISNIETDAIANTSWRGQAVVDNTINLEYLANLNRDDILTQEQKLQIVGTHILNTANKETINSDAVLAYSALSGILKDNVINTSWGGAIGVTSDSIINLDFLSTIEKPESVVYSSRNQLLADSILSIAGKLDINQDSVVNTSNLESVSADGVQLVENLLDYAKNLEIVTEYRSLLEKSYVLNFESNLDVVASKILPTDNLGTVFQNFILPLEWEGLDISGVSNIWVLDSRGTTWVLDSRDTDWTLDSRSTIWILDAR